MKATVLKSTAETAIEQKQRERLYAEAIRKLGRIRLAV